MAKNTQNSFQRGVLFLVILALLDEEDMYRFQLVQQISLSSGGKFSTQEGSLYPVLYKLLEQGFISDEKRLVGKRMSRIYYYLESAGRVYLNELKHDYEDVTHGVLQIIQGGGRENDGK